MFVIYINKIKQFCIGKLNDGSGYYVSFPTPTQNRMSDYEIYFRINFISEPLDELQIESAWIYVEECRNGQHKEHMFTP